LKGLSSLWQKKSLEEGDDYAQVVRFLGIGGFERNA
jgi:hypothetical protein